LIIERTLQGFLLIRFRKIGKVSSGFRASYLAQFTLVWMNLRMLSLCRPEQWQSIRRDASFELMFPFDACIVFFFFFSFLCKFQILLTIVLCLSSVQIQKVPTSIVELSIVTFNSHGSYSGLCFSWLIHIMRSFSWPMGFSMLTLDYFFEEQGWFHVIVGFFFLYLLRGFFWQKKLIRDFVDLNFK
jgi:hypothetical protein